MHKICDVIEKMKDQLYRLESIVNNSNEKDFDGARDLVREHHELLSELSSQLAASEDRWRQEQD